MAVQLVAKMMHIWPALSSSPGLTLVSDATDLDGRYRLGTERTQG